MNSSGRVPREHRPVDHDLVSGGKGDAVGVEVGMRVIDHGGNDGAARRSNEDAVQGIVPDDRVLDVERAGDAAGVADALVGELRDQHVLEKHGVRLEDVDAANAGPGAAAYSARARPVDVDVAQTHG